MSVLSCAVQCSAVQCSAVQCSAVCRAQLSALPHQNAPPTLYTALTPGTLLGVWPGGRTKTPSGE